MFTLHALFAAGVVERLLTPPLEEEMDRMYQKNVNEDLSASSSDSIMLYSIDGQFYTDALSFTSHSPSTSGIVNVEGARLVCG